MESKTLNADATEVQKFSDLAHHWWDPESEFRPLHEINPLRLDWIAERCSIAGQRVIDVGCGGGILAESLAAHGGLVTGIDLSDKALSVARLHLYESGLSVDYRKIPAEEMAEEAANQFDVVTCMEMLEHVPDPACTIAACARLTKPGGHVFFSTLNRTPKAYLHLIVGAEYLLKMLPRGTHKYARFIKPSELARFAREAGLECEELIGLHYNPLTKKYTLGGNTDVNYLIHCSKKP